jgi:hypothetical protein
MTAPTLKELTSDERAQESTYRLGYIREGARDGAEGIRKVLENLPGLIEYGTDAESYEWRSIIRHLETIADGLERGVAHTLSDDAQYITRPDA